MRIGNIEGTEDEFKYIFQKYGFDFKKYMIKKSKNTFYNIIVFCIFVVILTIYFLYK
jgi:thermostable 8-oxoguanine DNA glycosylase